MKDWIEHFQEAARGLAVAHVWRGYGSALFIEFGGLTPATGTRKDGTPYAPLGEIGLMIEAEWRVENARTIVCGSSSDEEVREATLARLVGKEVVNVAACGRLPEVVISLSNDFHVASFSTLEGDPGWALFDRRGPKLVTVGSWSGVISEEQSKSA